MNRDAPLARPVNVPAAARSTFKNIITAAEDDEDEEISDDDGEYVPATLGKRDRAVKFQEDSKREDGARPNRRQVSLYNQIVFIVCKKILVFCQKPNTRQSGEGKQAGFCRIGSPLNMLILLQDDATQIQPAKRKPQNKKRR